MQHKADKFTLIHDPHFKHWSVTAFFHTGEIQTSLTKTFFKAEESLAFINLVSSEGIELPKEKKAQLSAIELYQEALARGEEISVALIPKNFARGYKGQASLAPSPAELDQLLEGLC